MTGDFSYYYEMGEEKRKAKQYRDAIEHYRHALRTRPDHVRSIYNAGMCFYYLKEYTRALKFFKKVLSFNPDSASARKSYEKCIAKMGNEAETGSAAAQQSRTGQSSLGSPPSRQPAAVGPAARAASSPRDRAGGGPQRASPSPDRRAPPTPSSSTPESGGRDAYASRFNDMVNAASSDLEPPPEQRSTAFDAPKYHETADIEMDLDDGYAPVQQSTSTAPSPTSTVPTPQPVVSSTPIEIPLTPEERMAQSRIDRRRKVAGRTDEDVADLERYQHVDLSTPEVMDYSGFARRDESDAASMDDGEMLDLLDALTEAHEGLEIRGGVRVQGLKPQLTVTMVNEGLVAAEQVQVEVKIDGSGFRLSKESQTIPRVEGGAEVTVGFDLEKTGPFSPMKAFGTVAYQIEDSPYHEDLAQFPLSLVGPSMQYSETTDGEWRSKLGRMMSLEATADLNQPAPGTFPSLSGIIADLNLFALPNTVEEGPPYRGVGRYFGKGLSGAEYVVHLEVIDSGGGARIIMKIYARNEELLYCCYEWMLDEIEIRFPIRSSLYDPQLKRGSGIIQEEHDELAL